MVQHIKDSLPNKKLVPLEGFGLNPPFVNCGKEDNPQKRKKSSFIGTSEAEFEFAIYPHMPKKGVTYRIHEDGVFIQCSLCSLEKSL